MIKPLLSWGFTMAEVLEHTHTHGTIFISLTLVVFLFDSHLLNLHISPHLFTYIHAHIHMHAS